VRWPVIVSAVLVLTPLVMIRRLDRPRAGSGTLGFWFLKICLLLCAIALRAAGHRRHERRRPRARHQEHLDRGDVRRRC
jgi:hypothetical protein